MNMAIMPFVCPELERCQSQGDNFEEAIAGREHVFFGYDASGERTVKWSEHGESVYFDRMYEVETRTFPRLYMKRIFVWEMRLVSRFGDEGGSYTGD